jgi:hypothetical protein
MVDVSGFGRRVTQLCRWGLADPAGDGTCPRAVDGGLADGTADSGDAEDDQGGPDASDGSERGW